MKSKIYTAFFLIALIIFTFGYILNKEINVDNLHVYNDCIVKKEPRHHERRTSKGPRQYSCELSLEIEGKTEIFYINGTDYDYVDFANLYSNLRLNDTVIVYFSKFTAWSDAEYRIHRLIENEVDYCNITAVNKYIKDLKNFILSLSGIAILVIGFGAIMENIPNFREWYYRKIKFSWGSVTIIVMVFSFFILRFTSNTPYFASKYNYDKSYKNILKTIDEKTPGNNMYK